MSYIAKADYAEERIRPKLFTNYLEQMKRFLQSQNPSADPAEIDAFVKETIKTRAINPTVEAVVHKREGCSDHVSMPLTRYISEVIKDNNLSPSGSCYKPVSQCESYLRQSIDQKIQERSAFKKKYLDYEAQGQKRESQFYNLSQANAKIFNNAIAGGMKIAQFILGSKAGFNAITSFGRLCVKQGYSFIERCVNGNIYIPSTEDAITYVISHARHVPEEFHTVMAEGRLYVPTVDDVLRYLANSLKHYVSRPQIGVLKGVVENLTDVERSYVFYAGCFNNICRFNEDTIRPWIDSCFWQGPIDPSLLEDVDAKELKGFNEDVVTCVLSTNYARLGMNPEKPGKYNSLKDAAKFNPVGLKEFVFICRHFAKNFETMLPVIRSTMRIESTFSRLINQHRMARLTVPLSDTDSNIYSNQELVRWKRGKLDFEQESYEMNAMVTFILSQSLEHVFGRLAAGFGVEGKDVFRIKMKNEFLYPILLATSSAKHYLAIATMQEGALLPNPRKDIKGVGFRSSAYPKMVRDNFEAFVVDFFADIEKGEKLRGSKILDHVAGLEREIYDSFQRRESVYLPTQTVKREEEYADPAISQYFYYRLWTEVFAPDLGEMVIPNKCYKIPLKGGKKPFKNPEFLSMLEAEYPGIYHRLLIFMENNPREVTYLLIPPFKGQIHPLFLKIMDMRQQISASLIPFYHLLDGLGIGTVDKDAYGLVSDFYNIGQNEAI